MIAKYVELIAMIADAGSLGAAATRLGRSQPAVSKALQAAEAEFGCQIFQRSPAGVVPTLEGQRVVDRCQSIRRDLDLLSEDIAQVRGDVRGTLNLVVSPLAAVHVLPEVLRRYMRRYPGVQVQIVSSHSETAFQLLRTRRADYALGPAPEAGSELGLRSTEVVRTGLTFATGATSPWAKVTDPSVLLQANWVMIGLRGRRPRYAGYFERHGLVPPVPVICSDSLLTIMSLVEGSDYVCSVPRELFPDLARRWALKALDIEDADKVTLALTAEVSRVPTIAALGFEDIVGTVAGEMQRMTHNRDLCL